MSALFDRVDIVLFYGPLDGTELTIEAPPKPYLAFEQEKVIYVRGARGAADGRLVYDYDHDGTERARKRWLDCHDYS